MHIAVHALDTGHAGQRLQLVHVGGVDHEHRAADLVRELLGDLGTQLSGVLNAVGAANSVIQHDLVHAVHAAFHGQQAAAAAHNGGNAVQGHAALSQQGADGLFTVGQLIADTGVLGQLVGIVSHVGGEQLGLALVDGDLGGGGAGIDGQNLVLAHVRLLLSSASCRRHGQRK